MSASWLWRDGRGWKPPDGLPWWRACNEARAISKDLGRLTTDLWSLCSNLVAAYVASPFQGFRVSDLLPAPIVFDQPPGAGWELLGLGFRPEDDDWGLIEDPLASAWEDVVRQPTARRRDPLLAQHAGTAVRQAATSG